MPSQEEDTESELRALIGSTACGKYRIDRLIGRGGMGAVFQASNIAIGKRVALKFLDREAARNREACQRFQLEAEAASMVDSAHIVQIFDSGVSDSGLPFLVMELLTGEDLRARLRREGRLSVAAALRITVQILRGLLRAHQAGIIHRDLKPDNVFLCARDDDPSFVKLVDFGISKVARARDADTLTRRGTVLGTAFYMSPEQAQSFADIDQRTDLFSVGAILFEMLSGAPPHVARTYEAILIAICTHDAVDLRSRVPEVPEPVAMLVARALQRDRAARFQSAEEFLEAVLELGELGDESSTRAQLTRSTSASDEREQRQRGLGRHRTLVLGLIATLAGFALTAYWVARSNTRQPIAAEQPSATSLAVTPPVASGISVVAQSSSSSEATKAPPLPAPRSTKPRPKPSTKPSAQIAGGLQLSTKEP